jgi:hypothetical protein
MINKNYHRGFTLVETLGAVLLLSIALVGPMVIAEKGLQASLLAKDQNSAFNMAQDAVEYLRFARDTNCLAAGATGLVPCPAANWLSGGGLSNTVNLTPCISANGSATCYLDSLGANPAAPTVCSSGTCPVVGYDSSNNYLSYSGANNTIFTRTISIKYNPACSGTCNPSEADIAVTISWNDPLAHSIVVNESLYDWQ